jgi:hypothetical protein
MRPNAQTKTSYLSRILGTLVNGFSTVFTYVLAGLLHGCCTNRCGTHLLRRSRNSPTFGGFSGTTRVEEVVPKGPDLFLHRLECPLQVEVLDDHTHIVALREGPPKLVQGLQPIPHQLRLVQLLHLGLFLALALHSHLPVRCQTSYAIRLFTGMPRSREFSESGCLSAPSTRQQRTVQTSPFLD